MAEIRCGRKGKFARVEPAAFGRWGSAAVSKTCCSTITKAGRLDLLETPVFYILLRLVADDTVALRLRRFQTLQAGGRAAAFAATHSNGL